MFATSAMPPWPGSRIVRPEGLVTWMLLTRPAASICAAAIVSCVIRPGW